MNQKQKAKWERTRSKGMWRFVLLWVLVLSGSMLVVTSLFDYFSTSDWTSLERVATRAPIFVMSGFISGIALWLISERVYRKGS